jgi:pimeloyl-ACP methyl ester carboxylesterase
MIVDSGGHAVHALAIGDRGGPALLLVHGAAMDRASWRGQSLPLAREGVRVIVPDLPGHGASPGPAASSVEAIAGLLATVLDAAGIRAATVAGHSLGALAALSLAMRHPQKVSGLVLFGASLPMPVGEAFLAAARDGDAAAIEMQAQWGHARLAPLAPSGMPGLSLTDLARRQVARAAPGAQHAGLAACHAFVASDADLARIAVPVAVVTGTRDAMTPARAGEALAGRIPGARTVRVDAGHSMLAEAPQACLAALREALE